MARRSTKEDEPGSRRQAIRAQRAKKQQQQRLLFIGGVVVLAIIVLVIIIVPTLQRANTPVGEINQITPFARPLANGPILGDPNAKVKVDVFEDFQCPACQYFTQNVEPQVVANYVPDGKILYTFHHYPFISQNTPGDQESSQAANASMCANEQGRFWDFHDMLFANQNGENQGGFADNRLVAFANTLGLDMNKFNACFKADKYKDQIQADFAKGQQMGVNGTPSIFINGVFFSPTKVPTYEELKKGLDDALAAK